MFEQIRTRTAIALALATAAAVAAPSAGARPADVGPPAAAVASRATPPPHAATRIVEVRPSGFDWGDAGLGAAGTLSLLGLGAGAVALTRRSRATVT